jgi:hypothetical protein
MSTLARAKITRSLPVPSSPTRSLKTSRESPDLSHAQAVQVQEIGGWSKWKIPSADELPEGHKIVFFSYPSKFHQVGQSERCAF